MDQLLIEVKTNKNYQAFRDWQRFTLFMGKGYKIVPILFFIVLPIATLVMLVSVILVRTTFDTMLFIFFALILAVYAFQYFVAPKAMYDNSALILVDEIIYRFFEDQVEIKATGEAVISTETYQYRIFVKIFEVNFEVNSAFYLMPSNNASFIIPKCDLNAEQIEYLSRFFASHFKEKYKSYA